MLLSFIFDLELMTLEKGKNAGIRPLFWQNRRLGGVLFRRITVYICWQVKQVLFLAGTKLRSDLFPVCQDNETSKNSLATCPNTTKVIAKEVVFYHLGSYKKSLKFTMLVLYYTVLVPQKAKLKLSLHWYKLYTFPTKIMLERLFF